VVNDVKLTVKPASDVAVTAKFAAVESLSANGPKVIACTSIDNILRETLVAAAYVVPPFTPPPWAATTVHVPGVSRWTNPALETVHTADVVVLNVTLRPDDAVATTEKSASVDITLAGCVKVIVCAVGAILVIVNEDVTLDAAAHNVVPSSPPGWLATIVHVPAPTTVNVEPLTVHLVGVLEVYVSGKPDDADPGKVNGALEPLT
jgi:hypothetical protein